MNHRFARLLWLGLMALPLSPRAQSDLFAQLDSTASSRLPVLETFKGVRVINQHSVEVTRKHTLEFVVQHRFGSVSTPNSAWGFDGPVNTRVGFEYGVTERLMIGIGRSTEADQMDAFAKFRLLRQTQDDRMPVSVTLMAQWNFRSDSEARPAEQNTFVNRSRYAWDLLVARRITQRLSLQISATAMNFPLLRPDARERWVVGAGAAARYKVSRRIAITADLALPLNDYTRQPSQDHPALGVGVDIETGGHVFQLHLTNAFGMIPTQYQAFNATRFDGGGFRLGFNLHRSFLLKRSATSSPEWK